MRNTLVRITLNASRAIEPTSFGRGLRATIVPLSVAQYMGRKDCSIGRYCPSPLHPFIVVIDVVGHAVHGVPMMRMGFRSVKTAQAGKGFAGEVESARGSVDT